MNKTVWHFCLNRNLNVNFPNCCIFVNLLMSYSVEKLISKSFQLHTQKIIMFTGMTGDSLCKFYCNKALRTFSANRREPPPPCSPPVSSLPVPGSELTRSLLLFTSILFIPSPPPPVYKLHQGGNPGLLTASLPLKNMTASWWALIAKDYSYSHL